MLLAMERSGSAASAAVFADRGVDPIAEVEAPAGCRGDAWPLVRDVLAAAGISARDLTALAVGTGPGSFSGIRAALAIALGIAVPDGLPVHGVLSAAAAVRAWRSRNPDAPRAVLLGDARRGHVWKFREPESEDGWATLEHAASDISLLAAPGCEPDDPAPPLAGELEGAGDRFSLLLADPARLAPFVGDAPFSPAAADAATVGRLALAGIRGPALPVYLHPAVAARKGGAASKRA